jgi:tetratricopeptide (TPR) repeat protein/TolB-like protein
MAAVFLQGRAPATAADGRRSLAVLYFDNVTGDPGLDWLRTGLTDMLVTNLSQSSDLRVLSTQRLYQILDETGHRDDRSLRPGGLDRGAQAQATTALVGSFVRAGERIRIHASLQDPSTGEVIASERVEGDPEAGLFLLVDELTTRLRKRLETPSLVRFADKKEKKLQEVTTTSVEAYKAYAEGSRLHERLQERDAKEYFEKAVEADPSFAMALAKLSVVSANLGDVDKAREYSAKAVAKSESLPPGERYYIEGRHYSLDPTKTEKAVAAYQKAVDSAPDHTAARNNLAQALINLHRYPEALVHLEELRRRGMAFPGSYMSLAETYLATGQPDKARDELTSYVAAHLTHAGLENLGFFELSGARRTRRSRLTRPRPRHRDAEDRAVLPPTRCATSGPGAEGCAKRLMSLNDGRERWEGGATLAVASLSRRRRRGPPPAAEGIRTIKRLRAGRGAPGPGSSRTSPASRGAADAEQAIAEKGAEPKPLAEDTACVSPTHLGRAEEAKQRWPRWTRPSRRSRGDREPYRLQFQGELALARGDQEAARKVLEKAVALLPPDSISMDSSPVEIRYSLGRAALAEGDDTAARNALAFVVEAGPRRVSTPLPYVRSLALLANLEEKQGRVPEARKLYERYLSYWKHGQIDRTEVARAGQRLAALRTRPVA